MDKLAGIAVAADPARAEFHFFQFAKGLSEFRQGRFGSAMDWLKPVVAEGGDAFRTVQASMVLAMTQYRLEQVEQARQTFRKGTELADRRVSSSNIPEGRWNDWLYMQALMQQARKMVEAQ